MTDQVSTENPTIAAVEAVAQASAVWASTSDSERARVITGIADALDAAADTLIPIAMEETNLPDARLRGELKRTTFQLRLFAQTAAKGEYLDVRIDRPDQDWPMGAPRPDLRRMLLPIGPVLVFSASNFPFAFSVAGGDTAAALAAGNAVLVKAHSGHPKLSDATVEVIREAAVSAGAPADLVAVIHGTQNGADALRHPLIKAASFTGSIPGGRALFDIANSRQEPIPFYGELGSVNPAFVLPQAATERGDEIAEGYLASVTGSQGQLCTKPGLLLVPEHSSIIEHLQQLPAPAPGKLLNTRISSGFEEDLKALSAHQGVSVLRQENTDPDEGVGVSLLTTTVAELLEDPEALITEVFGPAALIATYTSTSELVELAGILKGQLTATLVGDENSQDGAIAGDLIRTVSQKAGRVLWNQWPTGVSVTYAQQHGGPYPATTAPTTTAVGTAAISRFLRPVAYQNLPEALLPAAVQNANPLQVPQQIDG